MINRVKDTIGGFLIPVVVLGSIGTVVYLSNANSQLRQDNATLRSQLDNTKTQLEQTKENTEDINLTVEQLNSSMLCFFELLGRENRAELKIVTFEPCVIRNTDTGQDETVNTDPKADAPANGAESETPKNTNPKQPSQPQQPEEPPVVPEPPGQPNLIERLSDLIRRTPNALRNLR